MALLDFVAFLQVFLMSHAADARIKDSLGQTPIDIARR
jgi:hypothetical protein